MRRKAEEFLKGWYDQPQKKPLILRGARQVGKSTLVRNFCRNQGIRLLEINLEKTPLPSMEVDRIDPTCILQEIELEANQVFRQDEQCLVFIDEIQAQPKAIRALRYLYEDLPHVSVIAAGSLLEVILSSESISFPVGRVEFYYLGPMSFSEFLEASGKDSLLNAFNRESLQELQGAHLQSHLFDMYKSYLAVGGMPEAVKVFFSSGSFADVRRVQQSLIETYRADFPKYGRRTDIHLLDQVFTKIPPMVGRKMKYVEIAREQRSRDIKGALDLLLKAQVVSSAHHTNATQPPIEAQKDEKIFKIFYLDVGLWNCAMKTDIKSILAGDDLVTTGAMAEQFVAQHLMYLNNGTSSPSLYYWLKDKTSSKAEVDFVLEWQSKIFPIEVKAGKAARLKSLQWFMYEKKSPLGVRISKTSLGCGLLRAKLSDGQRAVEVEGQLLSLPHYYIERLPDLLKISLG